jgi:hypothetical protein
MLASLDLNHYKIQNLDTGTLPQDAVNLAQVISLIANNGIELVGAQAEAYGAKGDGTTDDTAALQAAINTGKVVLLKKNKTYLISSGLDHVAGSGLVCLEGIATIKAKTGSGGFNVTSMAAPRTGLDRNMFRCNQTDNVFIRNVHFTTDGANEVVLHGVRLYGGMGTVGYDVEASFSGFFNGQLVAVNSVGAGRRRFIHVTSATDCGITQGSARFTAGAQTTVVEVDNDIIASTPSSPGIIKIGLIKNILYTGQALTDFGQQTDGVNIVCQGANSTSGWGVIIDNSDGVGEPIDIQSWKNSIRIGRIRNAYNFAIKLIHGAQENDIDVGVIENSGNAAVAIYGSASSACDRNTLGNNVRVGTIINPGSYGIGPAAGYAVLFGNSNSTYKPVQNTVEVGNVIGDGVNLDNVVSDGGTDAGNDNLVIIKKASGFIGASVNAPKGNVRVKYLSRCFAEMTMSTSPTVTSTSSKLAFDTVGEDTEGVMVSASNQITFKWPGIYRLRASVRMDSWRVGASDRWQLDLKQNTTVIRTACGMINFSGKDETAQLDVMVFVDEDDVGTTNANYTVWMAQDTGANKTVSNAIQFTRLSTTRVG